MTHPNTVAFSAGAVCCPDRASAVKHQQRGDWCVHPAGRVYVRRYSRLLLGDRIEAWLSHLDRQEGR